MNKLTVENIKSHAIEQYRDEKKECCGFIIAVNRKEVYFPCKNIAPRNSRTGKWDSFAISAEDYSIASDIGQIIAIVHSHPDGTAAPTESDLVSCEESGLPWVIASVVDEEVKEIRRFEPTGYVAPLIGRQFYYNVLDCFTVIQDAFIREHGIFIERFPSEDGWWNGEEEIYIDNFEAAGFYRLPDDAVLQKGDVILMQAKSKRTNHAGYFLGNSSIKEDPHLFPVPDAMIHHFHGMLSERVPYQGWYRDITRMIIRHKDLS